jgi:hypothetical protein
MRTFLIAGAVVALMFTAACGKSEAEKQAEQVAADAKKAAEAMTAAGGDAAKGMADLGKAMGGLAAVFGAAAGGDGKTVEPVSFQALQSALPAISGWEMGKPRGERMTLPIPFSQTEVRYTKGDSEIEVKIVDTGFAQLLVAPWSMMMAMGYAKESSDGYEKATMVAGNPGFEKWDTSSKDGELNVFVGKRFLLSIEGRDLADTKVLHEFVSKMDLGKIAALK